MPLRRRTFIPALAFLALPAGFTAPPAWSAGSGATTYRTATWEELVPKGWNPVANQDPKLGLLPDSDPKVLQMMRELREVWDNAPTVPALAGAAIKLPGYVVPLEESKAGLKEFLLVPYFGACIHTPPPPANQIVHVVVDTPVKGFRSMDTVWVSGTLSTRRADSPMGTSGYGLSAARVERYVAPAR